MLLPHALLASLLLTAAEAPELLTTFAEGPDSHPEEARAERGVEGELGELPPPLPAAVPAPRPPPALTDIDWVIAGSVVGTLGTGLLVALGAMCAAGECENASGDGQAPMIAIATASSGLVVTGVVLVSLGAQPPDPDEPRHHVHASLGLSPTGASFRLDF